MNLSADEFEQIKDFDHDELTKEQELLIDKLLPNEELKECYKHYGVCEKCKWPKTGNNWCQQCNAQHFQQNFNNWTSGNYDIDKLIQNAQLNAKNYMDVLEWIEHDSFENPKYYKKYSFGTVYKVIWKDGFIYCWNTENNQWKRFSSPFTYICLPNSKDFATGLLIEVKFFYNFH